jgi:hypothetical protein
MYVDDLDGKSDASTGKCTPTPIPMDDQDEANNKDAERLTIGDDSSPPPFLTLPRRTCPRSQCARPCP